MRNGVAIHRCPPKPEGGQITVVVHVQVTDENFVNEVVRNLLRSNALVATSADVKEKLVAVLGLGMPVPRATMRISSGCSASVPG